MILLLTRLNIKNLSLHHVTQVFLCKCVTFVLFYFLLYIMQKPHLPLSQLCNVITETINELMPDAFWVSAEIGELNVRNGHCYMELLEKQAESSAVIAKMRANCWSNTYGMLAAYFESETGQALKSGMRVLLEVKVTFHPNFGMSLNVINIDPTYTMGDLAKQRLQVIAQLTAEGIIDMNKQLLLSSLPQRIAVISSPTAAGYGDFMDQIKGNAAGFVFYTKLFPAIMQGDSAEQSIIDALDQIYAQSHLYDVAVIIRGGGATLDLSCFDSYNLALNCAQFPLPIIAGIGHQRDVSIVDMVAHTSLKTPTAVAEFLILQFLNQSKIIDSIDQKIQSSVRDYTVRWREVLSRLQYRLSAAHGLFVRSHENKLDLWNQTIALYSPKRILEQGYTLTLVDGKPVRSVHEIKNGQNITTEFIDGNVSSVVVK